MDAPQTERTDAAGNPLRQIPLPQDSLGRQEPTLAARGKRAAADNLHVGSRRLLPEGSGPRRTPCMQGAARLNLRMNFLLCRANVSVRPNACVTVFGDGGFLRREWRDS